MLYYSLFPVEELEEETPFRDFEVLAGSNLHLIYEPLSNGLIKIIRLIATDPQIYLNPLFQPGSVIPFSYLL